MVMLLAAMVVTVHFSLYPVCCTNVIHIRAYGSEYIRVFCLKICMLYC